MAAKLDSFFGKKDDLRVLYGRDKKPDSEKAKIGGLFADVSETTPAAAKREVSRCSGCRRRVGLMGFQCRCGDLFCADHRYSDRHDCSYDYKAAGREAIAREKDDLRVPYGRGKKPDSEKSVDLRSEERLMSKSPLPGENKLQAVKLCTGDGMKDLKNPAPLEMLAMDPENKSIISGVFANSKENKDKASVKVYTRRVGQEVFWDTKLQRHLTLEALEMDLEICDELSDYRRWLAAKESGRDPKNDWGITGYSGNLRINAQNCWDSMELEHPATFEELGMDPENKGIISDFFGFVRANELSKRIGQASKKDNCWVYDSPGRWSIIAAMANYLKFDIYHLDLSSFSSLKELEYTLLSTRDRSVIAIEGLYQRARRLLNHSRSRLLNHSRRRLLNHITSDKVAANCLMTEINTLFSRRKNERIFVFTTHLRDQHDAASLCPVGRDIYINTSSPLPTSLPDGGKRTYHNSLLVSNLEKENMRKACDSTKGYLLPNFDATENKAVKVYSRQGRDWSNSTELERPPTFSELGKDPENEGIISDLLRFVRDKELYKRIGKNWRRGYLLYDSPGIDRSSLIAAMASYLKFDIYDLDLTGLSSIQELKCVLTYINRRSLIAIKDFDHWFGMHPNLKKEVESLRDEKELTLSGLFEIIEGLLAYKDQQIIVLTANHNHRDRYHTALLSPLNIDAYMHTFSPQPIALPDGGEIVELDSSEQKPLVDFDATKNRAYQSSVLVSNSKKENTRETSKRQCMTESALSSVHSTTSISSTVLDATDNIAHLGRAYQSGPTMFNSEKKDTRERVSRECLTKSVFSSDDSKKQNSLPDHKSLAIFLENTILDFYDEDTGDSEDFDHCTAMLPNVKDESATSSRWPISLPDEGHTVLLDPLEQSTQNIVHLARAEQCSSTVSLSEKKMARTLKRKYKTISVLIENHQQHQSIALPDGGEIVNCDATTNMGFQSGVLVSYSKRRCMTLSGVSGFYRTYSLAQKSFEVQETLLPLKQLRNSADTGQVRQIRTLMHEEPSNPCGSFPIHMDTLIGRFRRYLCSSLSYSVCIRSIFWEQPNDFVPLLSPRRLTFKGCVQLEKSPYLPGLLQIEAVERGLTKSPRYSGGSTGQSASSSHWPIGLLDGGNVVLLDPLEQSTKNVAHAAKADLCSPTVSLPKKKMVRKSLKTKCPTMSLVFEGNRQHFGRRCEGPAKSLGVTPICMKHGINRVSSVNRIHKPHGIHWLPFRQKWATKEGYSLRDERPFGASSLSMDEKLDSRLLFIHISHFARPSPQPLALPDGGEIVEPTALSSSEFAANNSRAHLVRQESGSTTSRYEGRRARETLDRQGITMSLCTAEDLQQHFGCKHKDAAKRLGVNLSMFKSTYRLHQVYWRPCRNKNNDSLAWKPFEERRELWFHMPDSLTWKSFKVLDILTLLEESYRIRHFVPRKRLAFERWNCSGGLTPQSASHWPVGLPDGGHIVPVSKKKNVTITFKRKCRSRSATFEDHNRHFSSRCKGAANSLGVKHMCKQHGINLVFTVKLIIRRQHGIHRCPFQRGFSFGGERLAEVISLMEVKLVSRLQFLRISWLARSSLRPLAFSHGIEIERHIAFSSSEFAATNNRARSSLRPLAFSRGSEIERHIAFSSSEFATTSNRAHPGRQGNGQRGSSGSHPERERLGETLNREGIASDGISYERLQQHFGIKRDVAARSLGISISTLKRTCRRHGINRWPYPRQRVLRPPDPHGENNPSPTYRTLSTIGQINLQNEMGGQNPEPNEFQLDAFADLGFFNTESASIAEISSDFDWTEFLANSIEGNVSGSLNLTVPAPSQQPMPTCSDPAPSQQPMPTCSDPALSQQLMPTCSGPAPSQQPMPTCSGPAPSQQPTPPCSGPALSQQPTPPCSGPALSQQPTPTIPDLMPPIDMMSDLAAREDTRSVELKIKCPKKTLRFEFPLMSGIMKLKEEVKKRLELEHDRFDVEYIDDEGDSIFLNCDEDLRKYLQLPSNQVICRLLVVDPDANATNLS